MSLRKDYQTCTIFNNETTKLSLVLTSASAAWCNLRDEIYNAAIAVFGKNVKKNVYWLEENLLTVYVNVKKFSIGRIEKLSKY